MSELFGDYKRPKAEIKYIEKFIKKFNVAKNEFKSKNYKQAIDLLSQSYELLLEIWDHYPKIVTLYLIMKSQFYCKEYNNCEETKSKLDSSLTLIQKGNRNDYFRIKSKILLYDVIIYFIKDDVEKSIDSVLSTISYIGQNEDMSIEERAQFFWKYIKGILKFSGIVKSKKFEIFQEDYHSMIFEDTKIEWNKGEEVIVSVKKVKKSMMDEYKSFMNSKLRGSIYEYLDKEFYLEKYGKTGDKVMSFLQKNIDMYVRDNNKQKLIENFETFLTLNRTDLKKELGQNMNQLIHEQKRRIETFDIIFSNLVGAFNYIFKNYLDEDENDISFRKYKPTLNKQHCNMKDLLAQMNSVKKLDNPKINELKNIEENKNNSIFLNFKKDIRIPPNTEDLDKIIFNNNIKNKHNQSPSKMSIASRLYNDNKFSKNNNSKYLENNNHKKNNNNSNNFSKKSTNKLKIENFLFRNINNFLIIKLISIFTPIFKVQNGVLYDYKTEMSYVPIIPKKKDLLNINLPTLIKSYYSSSIKGNHMPENQDKFFYYENFMLIKNCILFGICDGHGKNGTEISNLISVLYPTYIFYLIVDNNVIRRKQDINELMLKLFQIEESPMKTKDMHILRYILNKLGVEHNHIPFISGDEISLFNLLFEAIHLARNDLVQRYKVDIEFSGTTLCSGLLVGNKLYLANIGDSKMVLGVFNNKGNTWKGKQISNTHEPSSPNENKRIIQSNGRIDRLKNEYGDEFGELRVFEKDLESMKPGLAMTRSIGDEFALKIGVIYEPELLVYELGDEHRIIVVGSDGLWKYMTNDEVIKIAGIIYDEGGKAEEAANILIDKARKRWMEHTKVSKKDKNVRKQSSSSNKLGKFNNDFLEKKIDEGEYKKHRKLIDDITCLVIFLNAK